MRPAAELTSLHVRAAIAGEAAEIAWVAERFHPFVRAQVRLRLGPSASPQDVEDLCGDVWVVALQRLSDLEPRSGRSTPVLVRFLGTTALQLCNNFLRRSIRRRAAGRVEPRPSAVDGAAAETIGVVSRAARRDLCAQVQQALDGLAPPKRDVLVLRLIEQRTNREIAELLSIPPNTVAVRYRRALEELRAALPEQPFAEIRSGRPHRAVEDRPA